MKVIRNSLSVCALLILTK